MEIGPPKSRLKADIELDRISKLPIELIQKILTHLPIREAVRTSVLSRNWRDKSSMLTDLVFDSRCGSTQNLTTLVNIVDHVLLGHIGPIHNFELSNVDGVATRDVDRWILNLSRNSIKNISLTWKKHRYKIPLCLFSCQDLCKLRLSRCLVVPPPTFEGFRNLAFLRLTKVRLAQDVFENLCCPLLKYLSLVDCVGFNKLKIDAPNLQKLLIKGAFVDVSLENTNLTTVVMGLTNDVANGKRLALGGSSNLLKFLIHLPLVNSLHITGYFLKYLAVGDLPAKLPNPLLYLNFLHITITFHDLKEILTGLYLLLSSPALRELEILVWKDKQAVIEEVAFPSNHSSNCLFSQLRRVNITGISAAKAQLDFVEFLLSISPVLERMTIKPASADGVLELLKHLVQFKRASTNARIILDP